MHQEHNVAWNALASNYTFIRDNPHITPRRTGFFTKNLPTQQKQLAYFAKTLSKTITTFAETERAKYPHVLQFSPSAKLFSDEVRDRYPGMLNEKNQQVSNWVSHGNHLKIEIIDLLLEEGDIQGLLALEQSPRYSVRDLRFMGFYEGGFHRNVALLLHRYIFFNFVAAQGKLEGGEYLDCRSLWSFSMNFGGVSYQDKLPHERLLDVNDLGGDMVHKDLGRLQEYLKLAFSVLYRYEVLVREAGGDPKWDELILDTLFYL